MAFLRNVMKVPFLCITLHGKLDCQRARKPDEQKKVARQISSEFIYFIYGLFDDTVGSPNYRYSAE
jgi:hypothetical protein